MIVVTPSLIVVTISGQKAPAFMRGDEWPRVFPVVGAIMRREE
jgi:hypothetical protein